jgi:hypothetical protein
VCFNFLYHFFFFFFFLIGREEKNFILFIKLIIFFFFRVGTCFINPIKGPFESAFLKKKSAFLNQIAILECLGLRFCKRKF